MSAQPQLVVPMPDRARPPLVHVGSHRAAGRLLRCPFCRREAWTAFGRARALSEECRREGHR